MDAVLKLLLDDVPGAKLKHEIVDKNSRLGRVFNLSSLLRGHKIIYVIIRILKHLLRIMLKSLNASLSVGLHVVMLQTAMMHCIILQFTNIIVALFLM